MKFNLKNIWILFLASALAVAGYVLGMCGVSESCSQFETFYRYSFTVFEPILLFSTAVIPLALVLIFVRDSLFRRWLRFASWWLPLSILLIIIAPTSSNTWMPFFFDPTKEGLSWLIGGLFTVISIVLIVREARKKKS